MAARMLKVRRKGFVKSMYIEGVLDKQFKHVQLLQTPSSPNFVAELLTVFLENSRRILAELTKAMDEDVIHFRQADTYAHQLKGGSSSIGAQRVTRACVEFRQACEQQDLQGCKRALSILIQEFNYLQMKFEILIELEKQIVESSKPKE